MKYVLSIPPEHSSSFKCSGIGKPDPDTTTLNREIHPYNPVSLEPPLVLDTVIQKKRTDRMDTYSNRDITKLTYIIEAG